MRVAAERERRRQMGLAAIMTSFTPRLPDPDLEQGEGERLAKARPTTGPNEPIGNVHKPSGAHGARHFLPSSHRLTPLSLQSVPSWRLLGCVTVGLAFIHGSIRCSMSLIRSLSTRYEIREANALCGQDIRAPCEVRLFSSLLEFFSLFSFGFLCLFRDRHARNPCVFRYSFSCLLRVWYLGSIQPAQVPCEERPPRLP